MQKYEVMLMDTPIEAKELGPSSESRILCTTGVDSSSLYVVFVISLAEELPLGF